MAIKTDLRLCHGIDIHILSFEQGRREVRPFDWNWVFRTERASR